MQSCSGKLKSETVIIARINISFFILHLYVSAFTLGPGDRSEMQRAWNFRPASWRRSCKVISLPGIMQTSRRKTQVSTCQLAPRSRQMGCGWMWQAPMVLSSHCPLHHTHQTLQGAVEICETAFHTNPMLNALLLIAGGSSNPWIQQHDRNDRSELSEPKALYPLLCRF